MGHARKERVGLFGTDQRITSGPAARRPHSKAEYMTAPERFADSQIPLAPRAPSIHDPKRTFRLYDLPLFAPSFIATGPFARQLAKLSRVIMFDASILVSNEPVDCTKRQDGCRKREKLR